MNRILIELAVAIALTIGAIIASVTGASANELMVSGAFARASATPMAKSGAAYVTLMNHGSETDRLLSVSSPSAESAAVHSTTMDGDVMKMEETGPVELQPMGMIEMKPGGMHIMLMGLKAPLKKGDTLELTLTFEKAGDMKVQVPVGDIAADGHDHAAGSSG
jgi:copper(I)-binding protein